MLVVVEPATRFVAPLVKTAYRPFFDSEVMPVALFAALPSSAALASSVVSVDASRTKASKVPLASPATRRAALLV